MPKISLNEWLVAEQLEVAVLDKTFLVGDMPVALAAAFQDARETDKALDDEAMLALVLGDQGFDHAFWERMGVKLRAWLAKAVMAHFFAADPAALQALPGMEVLQTIGSIGSAASEPSSAPIPATTSSESSDSAPSPSSDC